MMQERSRPGFDVNFVASAAYAEPIQSLDRRRRLTFRSAEGGEIVLPDQGLRARMHRIDIEVACDMPDAPALQHRRRTPVENSVQIVTRDSRKPCVKIGR